MNIGFSTIYAWRPHVEHMHYLASLARQAGHSVSFLVCDGDLSNCYTKSLHSHRSGVMNCLRCRLGGLRSYESTAISSIGGLTSSSGQESPHASEWCKSSASTLGRFESKEDFQSTEFTSLVSALQSSAARVYSAALRWIDREKLDAICLFNGRIDATRAVMEAALVRKIPFVSAERTWFGDGILLLPSENCLGLSNVNRVVSEWKDCSLSRVQAIKAAKLIAARFLGRNQSEWRAYNLNAVSATWPGNPSAKRLLLLPGSMNEYWSHPDWKSGWDERTDAFDAIISHLRVDARDVVLRCHPNWAEKIGNVDGHKPERYYVDWCTRRGIRFISSRDRSSTFDLIQQCDAIVVCGGSAALEAGALGKQVIATGPSTYQAAGLESKIYSIDDLKNLTWNEDASPHKLADMKRNIITSTLRFAYTINYRIPQYVDFVRFASSTNYNYFEGASPGKLIDMLRGGVLQADDDSSADDPADEEEIVSLVEDRKWKAISEELVETNSRKRIPVNRRWAYRPIDYVRDRLPRGDR
jgi:hypothetical protein